MKKSAHPIDHSESYVEDAARTEFVPAHLQPTAAKHFQHVKRSGAFLAAWREMRETLYIGHVLPFAELPPFCEKYMRLLYDTDERVAMRAIRVGDPAFFIAWLFRLDQIDCEMMRLKKGLADRAIIARYRAAIDGYRDVAEQQLKTLGGVWPPRA